jgi:oligopeptide/dipeptide ABC transporter ATP-binding protein
MVTILVVMVIDFMLSRVLPGGPVRTVIGRNVRIAPEAQLALREQFGLNKPIFPDQFPSTVGKWVRGSLGISLSLGRLVSEILLAKLGNTLLLIGLGQVLAIVFGVTLALVAGWKRQARSCEIRSIRIRRRCSQWCRCRRDRQILQGETPNAADVPAGCRFHPRCQAVMDKCRTQDPPNVSRENGHDTTCWSAS